MSGSRRLIVDIIGARNLMPKDDTGSASAFCVLDYDGNRRKTKTKHKDLSPTWNERNVLPYGDGLGTVEINVYNVHKEEFMRHGFLGRVQIKVPDVVKQGQEALQWLRLDKGELGVKVWYEDPMQYLYVKVVEAHNLTAKDAGGTSDPYVKVAVGQLNRQVTTRTQNDSERLESEMEHKEKSACTHYGAFTKSWQINPISLVFFTKKWGRVQHVNNPVAHLPPRVIVPLCCITYLPLCNLAF